MELLCIAGPEDCGTKKIVIPSHFELKHLDLFEFKDQKEIPFPGIKENIENAKKSGVKGMDQVFDVKQIAHSLHQNIVRSADESHYIIGQTEHKTIVGPVLQVIHRSTFAKISETKAVFFDRNPIDSNDKYDKQYVDRNRQIGITVANEDTNDCIIFVFKNGCFVVTTGGYLVFDWPLVVVKSSGQYFTVSDLRNRLKVKSGVHMVFFAHLKTPVPVLFLRRKQDLKTKSEPKELVESIEKKKSEELEEVLEKSEESDNLFLKSSEEFKEIDQKVVETIVDQKSEPKVEQKSEETVESLSKSEEKVEPQSAVTVAPVVQPVPKSEEKTEETNKSLAEAEEKVNQKSVQTVEPQSALIVAPVVQPVSKSEEKSEETNKSLAEADEKVDQKSVQTVEPQSALIAAPVVQPVPKSEAIVETLGESDIKVEKIILSDLSDTKFIPDFIYDWINDKGYELERGGGSALLSIGPHSVVRRGKRLSDSTPIAAKVIVSPMDANLSDSTKAPQELYVSKDVKHQNIIKTLDVFCVMSQTPTRIDRMYSIVVMELAPNHTLETIVRREGKMTEDRAKQIFRQTIAAVVYLHSHHISHSQLRLDNCLLFDNDIVKLCDFREAKYTSVATESVDLREHKWLSVKYMPPEFFNSKEPLDLLKVDVWMCGCILYSLLTGNTAPFGDIDQNDRIQNSESFNTFIRRQTEGINELGDIKSDVSPKALILLTNLFETNPKNRITASQVSTHDWFQ